MELKIIFLLVIQTVTFCQCEHEYHKDHVIKKRSMVVFNKHNPTGQQSFSSSYDKQSQNEISDSLMKTLMNVLLETLKSLSHVNRKLADFFVQHHPSLTNVYNKMTKFQTTTTTPRTVILNRNYKGRITTEPLSLNLKPGEQNGKGHKASVIKSEVSENQKLLNTTQSPNKTSPVLVALSEFNQNPPAEQDENIMHAQNITAGFMTADQVSSNIVRARNIIADNVVVTGNTNTFQFQKNYDTQNERPVQPVLFSFSNKGYSSGFGLTSPTSGTNGQRFTDRNEQINRRNYFPPRQDAFFNGQNGDTFRLSAATGNQQMQPRPLAFNMGQQQTRQRISSHRMFQGPQVQPQLAVQRHQPLQHGDARPINVRQPISQFSLKMPKQTSAQLQTALPVQKVQGNKRKSFWDDTWSDFDDSDGEFYEDEIDQTKDKTGNQSVIRGIDITAGDIKAGSLYADSVKAEAIHVRKVIAQDVIVTARDDD